MNQYQLSPSEYSIGKAINELDEATKAHNSTFDEAKKIFLDVEKALNNIKSDYWYPFYLFPRFLLSETIPSPIVPKNLDNHPFTQITYNLGFQSSRLVLREVVTKYEYIRDAYGNILYSPHNIPYTNKIDESFGELKPVADCSRTLRVMVIENLPQFIQSVKSSIQNDTKAVNSALNLLRPV